ncbi:MAG: hypothetical protein U1F87_18635 [Kiritimatiellia bacterium]
MSARPSFPAFLESDQHAREELEIIGTLTAGDTVRAVVTLAAGLKVTNTVTAVSGSTAGSPDDRPRGVDQRVSGPARGGGLHPEIPVRAGFQLLLRLAGGQFARIRRGAPAGRLHHHQHHPQHRQRFHGRVQRQRLRDRGAERRG